MPDEHIHTIMSTDPDTQEVMKQEDTVDQAATTVVSKQSVVKIESPHVDRVSKVKHETISLCKEENVHVSTQIDPSLDDRKPYICGFCGFHFLDEHILMMHVRSTHGHFIDSKGESGKTDLLESGCLPESSETEIEKLSHDLALGAFPNARYENYRTDVPFTKANSMLNCMDVEESTRCQDSISCTHSQDIHNYTHGCHRKHAGYSDVKVQRAINDRKPSSDGKDCNKSTLVPDMDVMNLMTYSGEKTFDCIVCGKPFLDVLKLNLHIGTHIAQIRKANKCPVSFRSSETTRKMGSCTGEKSYQCRKCANSFKMVDSLNIHFKNHKDEKPYPCKVCGKSFARAGSFNVHKPPRANEKSHQCKICGQLFYQTDNLNVHLKAYIGANLYQCKTCGRSFKYTSHLKVHMRTHTGGGCYLCGICDKQFSAESRLKVHMRIHTGEKPFQCKICGKAFTQKSPLKMHFRIHTGEKPHKCKLCDKTFNWTSNLKIHMRIHTGEKPYQCKICDKAFAQTGSLEKHMRIHTGEKPYQCKICDIGFTRTGTLKMHKRIHTGEKPYQCMICDKAFTQTDTLKKHMGIHTGEKPYQCKIIM